MKVLLAQHVPRKKSASLQQQQQVGQDQYIVEGHYYALKALKKGNVVLRDEVESLMSEKNFKVHHTEQTSFSN